jgi:hypothetical protein
MPFTEIADYTAMALSYLRDDTIISPLPKGHSCIPLITNKTKLVCQAIQDDWKSVTIERKLEIVRAVDNAIKESKQKYQKKVLDLKIALLGENKGNWKDALLGVQHEILQDKKFVEIAFDADASHEYRTVCKTEAKNNTYSIIGSCFKTNATGHLSNNKGQGHCLDALFVARTLTQPSFTFALGDGCGGHSGDSHQDKMIARAGHFACKHAVRLLNMLPAPEAFISHYKFMLRSIDQEVRVKAKLEGTTLIAGRAFTVKEGYRCVGFNIGDSMCIGYGPKSKQCFAIAPARVISEGTAIFPTVYKEFEVHPFDVALPFDTIFILISDGIYDHLPCIQQSKKYPNDKDYRETLMDANFIVDIFKSIPADSKPEAYAEKLREVVFERMEKLRREKISLSESSKAEHLKAIDHEKTIDREKKDELQTARRKIDELGAQIGIQIGDDMAICVVSLPQLPQTEAKNSLSRLGHK